MVLVAGTQTNCKNTSYSGSMVTTLKLKLINILKQRWGFLRIYRKGPPVKATNNNKSSIVPCFLDIAPHSQLEVNQSF
jgi:hypothetical protein